LKTKLKTIQLVFISYKEHLEKHKNIYLQISFGFKFSLQLQPRTFNTIHIRYMRIIYISSKSSNLNHDNNIATTPKSLFPYQLDKLYYHSQPGRIGHAGSINPRASTQKIFHRELPGLRRARDDVEPRPLYPAAGASSGAGVHVLPVVQRAQSKAPAPWLPTGRFDQTVQSRLHEYGSRVLLPRATQVGLERSLDRSKIRGGGDPGVLHHDTGVLVWVGSALGRHAVPLRAHGLSYIDIAVLENDGRVSKYEINGPVDVTVTVKLSHGVRIQGVLVA